MKLYNYEKKEILGYLLFLIGIVLLVFSVFCFANLSCPIERFYFPFAIGGFCLLPISAGLLTDADKERKEINSK